MWTEALSASSHDADGGLDVDDPAIIAAMHDDDIVKPLPMPNNAMGFRAEAMVSMGSWCLAKGHMRMLEAWLRRMASMGLLFDDAVRYEIPCAHVMIKARAYDMMTMTLDIWKEQAHAIWSEVMRSTSCHGGADSIAWMYRNGMPVSMVYGDDGNAIRNTVYDMAYANQIDILRMLCDEGCHRHVSEDGIPDICCQHDKRSLYAFWCHRCRMDHGMDERVPITDVPGHAKTGHMAVSMGAWDVLHYWMEQGGTWNHAHDDYGKHTVWEHLLMHGPSMRPDQIPARHAMMVHGIRSGCVIPPHLVHLAMPDTGMAGSDMHADHHSHMVIVDCINGLKRRPSGRMHIRDIERLAKAIMETSGLSYAIRMIQAHQDPLAMAQWIHACERACHIAGIDMSRALMDHSGMAETMPS